ncbi:MAG: zinc finger domain-containing protein, partial [bacterium]
QICCLVKNNLQKGCYTTVGVGNIYANEALFAAKINPVQKASAITIKHYQVLTKKIKELLRYAIKHGGTTIRDYSDSLGRKGSFQDKLRVYGRQGQPCPSCGAKLVHIRLGKRSTVFCPDCQK